MERFVFRRSDRYYWCDHVVANDGDYSRLSLELFVAGGDYPGRRFDYLEKK